MKKNSTLKVQGKELTVSNLDKPMFPKGRFTKGELIHFYIEAAPFILPHLKNRPITSKRFPDGVKKGFFYEKKAPSYTPDWVATAEIEHREKRIRYILINDLPTLVWSANLANIEMHPYLFKAPHTEVPTYVVFDLDPGPGCDVFSCIELALVIQKILNSLKLNVYPKVSGSKGMQLYIPLNTKCSFDVTSRFAKAFAEKLEELLPDLVVSKMTKVLRKNKVLIDWSQNSRAKTTVSVYSIRAKSDVPYVSLPFKWSELETIFKERAMEKLYHHPKEALSRMKKMGDLFEPVLKEKQVLNEKHIKIVQALSGELKTPEKASKSRKSATKGSSVEYNRKRNFSRTSEPILEKKKKKGRNLIFVIQKHQASHLHFDFRLEIDGVLVSWAVPKGPPIEKGERRLAMHVEDHPIAYADFEGNIPKGNYGAGTVMVWDQGTYSSVEDSESVAHKKGKLVVDLKGQKLKGKWHLIKDRRDEKRWLMIMDKDSKVIGSKRDMDRSVKSGETFEALKKESEKVERRAKKNR